MQISLDIFSKNRATKIHLQNPSKIEKYTLKILFKKIFCNISHNNVGINCIQCTNLKKFGNNIS